MRGFGIFVGMVLLGCLAVLMSAFVVWFLAPTATDWAWEPGYWQCVNIVAIVYVLSSVARGVSIKSR